MDIKTAFLQGQIMEREVYVRPPQEADSEGKLWRLRKCVYGLCDASMKWYCRVKAVMNELGAKTSKVDASVFYWTTENEVYGILACHVDDFLWAGKESFEPKAVMKIREKMAVGKEESVPFQYIGLQIEKGEDGTLVLHQIGYVESVSPVFLEKDRLLDRKRPLNEREVSALRSKIGQVMWVARQSRPDVLFSVCDLASQLKDATVQSIIDMNKVVKQLKSEQVMLRFPSINISQTELVIYSDSSLGNLNDGGTQGAQVIFLRDGVSKTVVPIAWSSKRIRRMVRSTLAAETMAMADGIDLGEFISTLFSELVQGGNLKLVCVTDCKSLLDALHSTKCVSEKRLRTDVASIKEMMELEAGKLTVIWVDSQKQLADSLTKKGASPMKLLQVLETGHIM